MVVLMSSVKYIRLTVNEIEIPIPEHRYYLMNKPVGVVTARKDRKCQTIIDVLRPEDRYDQLYPVGRLDRILRAYC